MNSTQPEALSEILEEVILSQPQPKRLPEGVRLRRQYRKLEYTEIAAVLWPYRRCPDKKSICWQSLQLRRVVYLYSFSLAQIAREAGVRYRTIQYFYHGPTRVGKRSSQLITDAAYRLLRLAIKDRKQEINEAWDEWHRNDPRQIDKTLRFSLTKVQGNTSGEK